jgi:hypothetical protein
MKASTDLNTGSPLYIVLWYENTLVQLISVFLAFMPPETYMSSEADRSRTVCLQCCKSCTSQKTWCFVETHHFHLCNWRISKARNQQGAGKLLLALLFGPEDGDMFLENIWLSLNYTAQPRTQLWKPQNQHRQLKICVLRNPNTVVEDMQCMKRGRTKKIYILFSNEQNTRLLCTLWAENENNLWIILYQYHNIRKLNVSIN